MRLANDHLYLLKTSARRFFTGTLLSRLTGFGREVVMAMYFGANASVAAFWMAFRFAHLLRRIFGEGALNVAFIPHFEALRHTDAKQAGQFFYDLTCALVWVLIGIVILVEIALGSILHLSHLSKQAMDILHLTQLLLPSIVPIVLYALNSSFLNCEKRYFLPSVAPTVLNCIWIVSAIWLRHYPVNLAMHYLAISLTLAFSLQWLVTARPVICYFQAVKPSKSSFYHLGALIKPFFLVVLGVTATQINSALDAIFAHLADPSGPAYLWYALRIQQLPLALFGVAIASALLPPLSRAIAQQDLKLQRQLLASAIEQTMQWMIPIMAGLLFFAFPAIELVYGHGAFGQLAIAQTSSCLQAYALGLLPMSLVLILATPFYAQKQYKAPTVIAIGAVALNVFLNSVFVFVMRWQVAAIALSTSISALANAVALAKCSRQPIFNRNDVKLVFCTCVAISVTGIYVHLNLWNTPLVQIASQAMVYIASFFLSLKVTKTSYYVLRIHKPSECE